MNLARQINEKLDQILDIKSKIKCISADMDDDAILTNIMTDKKHTKGDALKLIENDLNEITRDGTNVRETFTIEHYVNDFAQDKRPYPTPLCFC